MKKLMIGFILIGVVGNVSLAQTDFHTNVTNLWYQGYKSNVLEIAEQRLSVNTNDIAGLILKAEYHLEFYELSAISNAYLRIVQVADMITTTNFVYCWQERGRRQNLLDILDYMAENPRTPQQIQTESLKGFIKYKPFPSSRLI